MNAVLRNLIAVGALGLLTACASQFSTDYAESVNPAVSKTWRVAQVQVVVPDSLTVSNENDLVPKADIVWQEDPLGDRRAQVATIMKRAVSAGAAGLRGSRRVNFLVTVQRFHALTPAAQALKYDNVGVLNIDFTISVTDARTGKVLIAPELIVAAMPGRTGDSAIAAQEAGLTQKIEIQTHVRDVIAGWLGIGPDVRGTFTRIGA